MNKSNIRTGIIDISSFQSGPEMSLTTLSAQVVSISGEKLWQVVKLICLLTFELISQNAHFFSKCTSFSGLVLIQSTHFFSGSTHLEDSCF